MIYKMARYLNLSFTNYIDCIDDLALIMREIPPQHYRSILNTLGENLTTYQIRHAIMQREGEESRMRVDLLDSYVAHDRWEN